MSQQERKKRERAFKIASAVGMIEGVPVSDEAKELYLKWVNGELTEHQLIGELNRIHKKCDKTGFNPKFCVNTKTGAK